MFPQKMVRLLLAFTLVFSVLPAAWAQAEQSDHSGHWAEAIIDRWLEEGLRLSGRNVPAE